MAKIKELEAVVRRLTENAGIDMSNPKRGINPGATPSVKNPVGQKLSSLADVDTYNVLDGQGLSWSQAGQKWLPVTPPDSAGVQWELATEEEQLYGDLAADADYETVQVIGIHDPYPPGVDSTTGGTGDGYGLVGTSTSSAFLHGAQRSSGGPTRAHGYVSAQPYYCKMGVYWLNDDPSVPWLKWGEVAVDRRSVYISTPTYQDTYSNPDADDGAIIFLTNWFYAPKFTTAERPIPPTGTPANYKGAMIYDMTLRKPLWWNGSAWTDALGTTV